MTSRPAQSAPARSVGPGDTVDGAVLGQLDDLLGAIGMRESRAEASRLLRTCLGEATGRPLTDPPAWPSDVADDHSPVEWSVAFGEDERPTARILVEPVAGRPDLRANTRTALAALGSLSGHRGLATGRLGAVHDLFLPAEPLGRFAIWFSLVLRRGRATEIKAYLNPATRGSGRSTESVAAALRRLGHGTAFPVAARHALRRGPGRDDCAYFALDLTDHQESRVKVYTAHRQSTVDDVVEAARAVPDVDEQQVRDFCALAGGRAYRFDRRPLMSSYSFTGGGPEAISGYSLYVPVRDYVTDDQEARERANAVLRHFGLDAAAGDDAITAVTRRPLSRGRGLISHLSLRMGAPRPGITVYLSSELYGVTPPRRVEWSVSDPSGQL